MYRSRKENSNADALSQNPCLPAPAIGIAEDEVQVASLTLHSVSRSGVSATEGTTLSDDGLHCILHIKFLEAFHKLNIIIENPLL